MGKEGTAIYSTLYWAGSCKYRSVFWFKLLCYVPKDTLGTFVNPGFSLLKIETYT